MGAPSRVSLAPKADLDAREIGARRQGSVVLTLFNPHGHIRFLLERRFPDYTDSLRAALSRADKRYGGLEPHGDELVDALWDELSPAERARLSEHEGDDSDASPLPMTRKKLKAIVAEAPAFEDQLQEMQAVEFDSLYNQERAIEEAEREAEANEKDLRAQHSNQPAKDISPSWRVRGRWTIEQAVALALGREPARVDSRTVRLTLQRNHSAFTRKYLDLLEDVKLSVAAGDLRDPIDPTTFVQWAKNRGIEFPAEATPREGTEGLEELAPRVEELTVENSLLKEKLRSLEIEANKNLTKRHPRMNTDDNLPKIGFVRIRRSSHREVQSQSAARSGGLVWPQVSSRNL